MIVCPNCNHQNPDGATQCEACYTPLPATTSCPNCGATVQTDASFCGQCGFNLKLSAPVAIENESVSNSPPDLPDSAIPNSLVEPELETMPINSQLPDPEQNRESLPAPESDSELPATLVSPPVGMGTGSTAAPEPATVPPPPVNVATTPTPPETKQNRPVAPPVAVPKSAQTQLQLQSAKLLHLQTNTQIELPQNLAVIHMGKSNEQIPPDIDVSGFPNSEIVSRVHADIRVEGDIYYIEDVGSSNGTYINHTPLLKGDRHRLRPGDRISLGKGDKVTFLFQIS
ncbi:MAG: FHA domain-containing protein [Symploca sp. SIO2E9]|nr:FHA domain-containing protein [Symploca sp. SIO2E9]